MCPGGTCRDERPTETLAIAAERPSSSRGRRGQQVTGRAVEGPKEVIPTFRDDALAVTVRFRRVVRTMRAYEDRGPAYARGQSSCRLTKCRVTPA
jgi:hypothetical protein